MTRIRTRLIAEMALTVALSAALDRFAVVQMPQGGSVSLDMLPLVVFAVRNGFLPGMLAGAAYGGIEFLIKPTDVVHPAQFLLDYPVAFAMLGLAGVAAAAWWSMFGRRPLPAVGLALAGCALGIVGRFGAHFLSGMVFFGAYAPEGQPVWLYSLVYNATYILPSAAATLVAAALVLPAIERAVPSGRSVRSA